MRLGRTSRAGRPSRGRSVGGAGGGGGASGLSAAIQALAPMHHWKFDDVSGNAVDYGSVGTDATPVSIIGYQGVVGADGELYVNLDGTSDYYTVADAPALSIDLAVGKTFTIAFRPTTIAKMSLMTKMTTGADRDWALFDSTPQSNLDLQIYNTSGIAYSQRRVSTNPTLNQWNFVVARVAIDGVITMWQNSTTSEGAEIQTPPNGTFTTNGTAPVWLGAAPFAGYRLGGGMAHAAIFNEALTDGEIEGVMTEAITEGWTP